MLVGAGVAFVVTRALHLHSGYWAMITVCLVVQGNIGGTLDAGLTQFAGTLVGGVLGMAGVWLRAHHLGPDWLILFAVLTPLAVLSASNTHLRTSPVTALIVMLVTSTSGSGIDLGLTRIGEIALGSVIGIAVSILVLPGRAVQSFERHIAAGLGALGPLAAAHLNGDPPQTFDPPVHAAIAAAQDALTALHRERALRLATSQSADPLLRGLRRLRTDVALLSRAVAAEHLSPALAPPLQAWFAAAAASLLHHTAPPPLPRIDTPPDPASVMGFALDVLLRDMAGMAELLTSSWPPRR
jgi:uncharacterized membrane protein YccC